MKRHLSAAAFFGALALALLALICAGCDRPDYQRAIRVAPICPTATVECIDYETGSPRLVCEDRDDLCQIKGECYFNCPDKGER